MIWLAISIMAFVVVLLYCSLMAGRLTLKKGKAAPLPKPEFTVDQRLEVDYTNKAHIVVSVIDRHWNPRYPNISGVREIVAKEDPTAHDRISSAMVKAAERCNEITDGKAYSQAAIESLTREI